MIYDYPLVGHRQHLGIRRTEPGGMMPWAKAVPANLDRAEAEGREWTVEGKIVGQKFQFKKSALNLLELVLEGGWTPLRQS